MTTGFMAEAWRSQWLTTNARGWSVFRIKAASVFFAQSHQKMSQMTGHQLQKLAAQTCAPFIHHDEHGEPFVLFPLSRSCPASPYAYSRHPRDLVRDPLCNCTAQYLYAQLGKSFFLQNRLAYKEFLPGFYVLVKWGALKKLSTILTPRIVSQNRFPELPPRSIIFRILHILESTPV